MTGAEIQARIDALVTDLQTVGKGQTVNVMFRNPNNTPLTMPLSSNAAGVVNQAQLDAINGFAANLLIPTADSVTTLSVPVTAASEAFKAASQPHEALRISTQTANAALKSALDGDATYQSAKAALDAARANPDYIDAQTDYKYHNVSENFAALAQAKGEYVV